MTAYSFAKDKLQILLLEGIHPGAIERFKADGYTHITTIDKAIAPQELLSIIPDYHFLGIRSRTQVSANIIHAAKRLSAIGCFCIGTNHVDLATAMRLGIPVFNAPYSNTRSVAELVLAEIIMLFRGIPEKNALAHRGGWHKSAKNSHEIRGKVLGIIGYGHIGSQLSVLAESLGMQVYYYDIETKLALGNAQAMATLHDLLKIADVVTLHVPATNETKNMLSTTQFNIMKKDSLLINAARGTVVDIDALCFALKANQLAGAAIDVFPQEPSSNNDEFLSPLRAFDNVLLTPHIGGSTVEAQQNIGQEVASKIIKYSNNGSTLSAVNFPEVSLPQHTGFSRILHIHNNVPGILQQINHAFSERNINIAGQYLQTNSEIGYVVIDITHTADETLVEPLRQIRGTIKVRILY